MSLWFLLSMGIMEHTIHSIEADFGSFSRAQMNQNIMELHPLTQQLERNSLTLSPQFNDSFWGTLNSDLILVD